MGRGVNIITCLRQDVFDESFNPRPEDGFDKRVVRFMQKHDGTTERNYHRNHSAFAAEGNDWEEAGGRPWFWMCRTSSGFPKKVVVGENVCFIAYKGRLIGYFDIVDLGKLGDYTSDPADIDTEWGQQNGVIMANWHSGDYGEQPGFQGWRYTELQP